MISKTPRLQPELRALHQGAKKEQAVYKECGWEIGLKTSEEGCATM